MKFPKRTQYKYAKLKKYRVRNWAEYNEALCHRGDLTVYAFFKLWRSETSFNIVRDSISFFRDAEGARLHFKVHVFVMKNRHGVGARCNIVKDDFHRVPGNFLRDSFQGPLSVV